jgi:hypothetical protein
MKKIYKKIGMLVLLLASACKLDGDLQDPNNVSVAGADADYLLNAVQLNFADFFHSASGTVDPLVRMQAMTGGFRYQTAYNPSSLDNLWNLAYRGVLINNATMQPLAAGKTLTTHVAVGKILEAYTWLTLVDLFNDVPQTEALQAATGVFNPASTSGSDIYKYAIALLTEARTNLALTGTAAGAALARDNFYGGDRAKWNALANSLELKAWINISMIPARAAEANAKIATFVNLSTGVAIADLVDTPGENFTYKYGTVTAPSGSRHPWYDQYYGSTAGTAGGYLNNYYLHEVFGKWDPTAPTDITAVKQDPRWRYYFYRQVGSTVSTEAGFDPKAIFCGGSPPPQYITWGGNVFCTFQPGFFGRDHGDASGTPPDGAAITCAGAYPAGGRVDTNSTTNKSWNDPAKRTQGANGAGIEPIFMGFFTDYTRAELMSRAGQTAIAKSILATAIDNSIADVTAIAKAGGQTLAASLIPDKTKYQTAVAGLYDAAAKPMDVIGKEYWIALFGNGVEAYNLYRRTSAPRGLQPTIQISTDPYFRSMVYPAVYANLNSSATQKNVSVTNKVFWDNNPDNLN